MVKNFFETLQHVYMNRWKIKNCKNPQDITGLFHLYREIPISAFFRGNIWNVVGVSI